MVKIVLQSSTKFYGVKLNHLAQGSEPKRLLLFSRVAYNTRRNKGSPFSFFRHCETYPTNFYSLQGVPLHFFWYFATEWMLKIRNGPLLARQFGPTFFSDTVDGTLDTLKFFCYFWALDMAPTYALPGLFNFLNSAEWPPNMQFCFSKSGPFRIPLFQIHLRIPHIKQ